MASVSHCKPPKMIKSRTIKNSVMELRTYIIEIRKQLKLSIESAEAMNTIESRARANAYRHVLESVQNALRASDGNHADSENANCVIFRIDGNRCFSEPLKGVMGHYKTREGAEKYLKERGFYLETRKWQHIGGHEEGTKDNKWYNKKLSEDGYSYDNTSYAFITEVELRD